MICREPHIPFIKVPISAQCFVSVVIPVRDEAENIVKTLEAFAVQTDLQDFPLNSEMFEVIILANNCRDNSAEIIRNWQKNKCDVKIHLAEIILPEENANIGFVRRLLMNEAFSRLRSNKFGGGIIATTDGDTRIAPDWIANIVREIENGADAVGGRILIDEGELRFLDEKARRFHLLDEEYRLLAAEIEGYYDNISHDPNPRHHQHFNGSFAVTTDAFEKAGGIPDVKFLEDVAFYHSLLRCDAKFRHSPNVKVFTSARNYGRTALGLSTQLKEWEIMGENNEIYLVESARTIEKRLTTRQKLKLIWEQRNEFIGSAELAAEQIYISQTNLSKYLKDSFTFGVFVEKIYDEQGKNDLWNQKNSLVSVESAIEDLQKRLADFRSAAKSRKKTA